MESSMWLGRVAGSRVEEKQVLEGIVAVRVKTISSKKNG